MNAEFGWSIAIIVFGLLIGGIAIALYFYWKNRSDFKKEGEVIVWSLAIASFVVLILGLAIMVWAISKRVDKDVSEKSLQEQITNAPCGPRFTLAAPSTLPEPIISQGTQFQCLENPINVLNTGIGETDRLLQPKPKPILRRTGRYSDQPLSRSLRGKGTVRLEEPSDLSQRKRKPKSILRRTRSYSDQPLSRSRIGKRKVRFKEPSVVNAPSGSFSSGKSRISRY